MAALIRDTDLDWLILADWNREPEEVVGSTFARFLRGTVVAPDIPLTCTSTAEGGGRVIDFGLAFGSLAPKLQCVPVWDVLCKPHIVALDCVLEIRFLPDCGNELLIPSEIPFAIGPREAEHSWFRCLQAAREELGDPESFLVKWRQAAPFTAQASSATTWTYALYSNAAERYALACNQEATDDMRGGA